jgi:hypothetical protein
MGEPTRRADTVADKLSRFLSDMWDLRRSEFVAIGLWMVAVVMVNKVLLGDTGSGWGMLLSLAFWSGFLLVHLARAVRNRSA